MGGGIPRRPGGLLEMPFKQFATTCLSQRIPNTLKWQRTLFKSSLAHSIGGLRGAVISELTALTILGEWNCRLPKVLLYPLYDIFGTVLFTRMFLFGVTDCDTP